MQWPTITSSWYHQSNYLICVSAPDEVALAELAARAHEEGIAVTIVREPDLCDEITAVALEPGAAARRLCANLPNTLRRPGYSGLAVDRKHARERSAVPG